MLDWIQFIVATLFIVMGVFVAVTATFGTYKFKFTLSRMHAAAMGDTLGISFVLVGLMVINGFGFETLKLLLILMFLWFASPVASHLLARLEFAVDKEAKECEVIKK